jgi:O-antigen/teichoic acid export membrane protein
MTLRLHSRMDIVLLKGLGESAEEVGYYGAASNLMMLPMLFSMAVGPLLLASLVRLAAEGRRAQAVDLAGQTLRAVTAGLPLVALVAATAHEIVPLLFGSAFVPAADLLRVLVFGAFAKVVLTLSSNILVAADRERWTLWLMVPLPILALSGYVVAIPRAGAIGAAAVTTVSLGVFALVMLVATHRAWRVPLPVATLIRSVIAALAMTVVAPMWPVSGPMILVKLMVLGLVAAALLVVSGELSRGDLRALGMIGRGRTQGPDWEDRGQRPGR